jgi:hypothetical protein
MLAPKRIKTLEEGEDEEVKQRKVIKKREAWERGERERKEWEKEEEKESKRKVKRKEERRKEKKNDGDGTCRIRLRIRNTTRRKKRISTFSPWEGNILYCSVKYYYKWAYRHMWGEAQ